MSYRDYWTVPQDRVFTHTGANNADGVDDLRQVLAALDVDLSNKDVLDVGCGTGRLRELCGGYLGVDIAPSQVEYASTQGHAASLIDGPDDLEGHGPFDVVCCFSVFTHIPWEERFGYLDEFVHVAPELVVDILPGVEGGDVPAWYANESNFEGDLYWHGYSIFAQYDRVSGDGVLHRYYHARL